ncbi:hypothetical protein M758_N012600 [Ceratodon purpureus]|nr:hypothetical protein M758_N012600 [Ceratodon purpureus]
MVCLRNHSSGDEDLGSPNWFCVEKNLNDYGYVLGAPRRERDALPDDISNEEMCTQRWGEKRGGKFWYAKKGSSESPRMRYRVEKLYQETHQRPIGSQRGISLGFARGLITEKKGYAVDWATYAAKQCKRGKKPFQSMEALKSKTRAENGDWPRNEVYGEDEIYFDGAPDDWEVNRRVEHLDPRLVNAYNLREALPTVPEDIVAPPMYTSGRNLRVTMESESLQASLEEQTKNEEEYGGGHGCAHEDNTIEGETAFKWQGESSRGKHRTTTPFHKWGGCPLSPDVSVGFPDGSRRVEEESEDEDDNNYCPSAGHIEQTLKVASPGFGREVHINVGETQTTTPPEAHPGELNLFMAVYGTVCVEMDYQAQTDGFDSLTVEEKFGYLRDREVQYESEWRKRRAEENARMQWIAAKRRRTQYVSSPQDRRGSQSHIIPGEEGTSDDIDMYERPGTLRSGNTLYERGARMGSTVGGQMRVSGEALDLTHKQSRNTGELGILSSPSSMSPLRFADLPLMVPKDVGTQSIGSTRTGPGKKKNTSTIIIPDSDTE